MIWRPALSQQSQYFRFVIQTFSHICNNANGIKKPQDLTGKKIGELALYGHNGGIWPKGILSDEYGFKPEQCSWTIGKLDWPLSPTEYVSHNHLANVSVNWLSELEDLGELNWKQVRLTR